MECYLIVLLVIELLVVWLILSVTLYKLFFKRFYDLIFSALALIVLLPLLLLLTIVGAIIMKGNPFFVQKRPGKINKNTGKEKIFWLLKFRTMSNLKDKEGNLLPDEQRLSTYGRFLRATSLDELPELVNILKADMSIVGPRPLLVKYLALYTPEQRRRHIVRPGITGLAQIHGRNAISWEEKFNWDVKYVDHFSFFGDVGILFLTLKTVITREGINSKSSATMEEFKGSMGN